MIKKLRALVAAFLVNIAFVSSSHAAVILKTDSDGQLTGAVGVTVAGKIYDVMFADGTCIELFSGCNDPGDFIFGTSALAATASKALLEQVFVGIYDTNPASTRGCANLSGCGILTPYADAIYTPDFLLAQLDNRDSLGIDAVHPHMWLGNSVNTADYDYLTFAVWTNHVPEPSTIALLGVAALALIWSKRPRQQAG